MFKLITKQGLLNIKTRWKLYTSYFFFLFFAFLIIISFFGFVFQFDYQGHQIVRLQSNPSYVLKLFNYSIDESETDYQIKVDAENRQDLLSFSQDQFSGNPERLKKLLTKAGQQKGYLKSEDWESTDFDAAVQKKLLPYANNFLFFWFYQANIFPAQVDDHLTGFDVPIELTMQFQNQPVKASTYKIENPEVVSPEIDLKVWQSHDFLDEFYWVEKSETLDGNKTEQIVITPKFGQKYHFQVNDWFSLTLPNNKIQEFKVVGIAVKRNQALINNSQNVFLNPVLYNEIIKADFAKQLQGLDVASKIISASKTAYNRFCEKQFQDYEQQLTLYFTNPNQQEFGALKTYQATSSGSLATQVFVYYLLAAIICCVLMGMIIVIYLVVSENNLQNQKEQILFLKALGLNNPWLGYDILISVLPFILGGFALAIGISVFVYQLICSVTTASLGFILPPLFFNNWPLTILIVFLILVVLIIAYFLVAWKIRCFSLLQQKAKTESFWKTTQSFKKIMVGQAYTRSTTLKNLTKSWQLLFISFFTFLALGVTFEFLDSIKTAVKSNEEFFAPYQSYSYQILRSGQLDYQSRVDEQQLLTSGEFEPFDQVDFSNLEKVEQWINQILNSNQDVSHQYFTQIKDFIQPQTLLVIQQITDEKIRTEMLNLYQFAVAKMNYYYQTFGHHAPDPIVNFKYSIFPQNYWLTAIFKTQIGNQTVTTFADQKFDSSVLNDEVIVNYLLASKLNLQVGDTLKISYDNLNGPTKFQTEKTVTKIETRINNENQMILNSTILSDWKIEPNALFSGDQIPIGLRYITIPMMSNGDGTKWSDYWDFNQRIGNNLNLNVSSLKLISAAIHQQTLPYTNLLLIISVFMIILSLVVLFLISLMFSLENQAQILFLKMLGYRFSQIIRPISWLFGLNLLFAWGLGIGISGLIIRQASGLLLSKIFIQLEPIYNFLTLGVTLILGLLMLSFIILWIYYLYSLSNIQTWQKIQHE